MWSLNIQKVYVSGNRNFIDTNKQSEGIIVWVLLALFGKLHFNAVNSAIKFIWIQNRTAVLLNFVIKYLGGGKCIFFILQVDTILKCCRNAVNLILYCFHCRFMSANPVNKSHPQISKSVIATLQSSVVKQFPVTFKWLKLLF